MKHKKKGEIWAPKLGPTLAGLVLSAWLTIPSAEAREKPLPAGTPTQQAEILIEQGRTEKANEILYTQEKIWKQHSPKYKTPAKENILRIIATADNIGILDYVSGDLEHKTRDITRRFESIIAEFEETPVETLYTLRPELRETFKTRTYKKLSKKLDDLAEDNIQARAGRFFTSLLEAKYDNTARDLGFLKLQYPDKQEKYLETFTKLADYAHKQSIQLEIYTSWAKNKDKAAAEILEKEQHKLAKDYNTFMRLLYVLDWDAHDTIKQEHEQSHNKIVNETNPENYKQALKEIQ